MSSLLSVQKPHGRSAIALVSTAKGPAVRETLSDEAGSVRQRGPAGRGHWHLVEGTPVQFASTSFRCAATPLFEEERETLVGASEAQVLNPFRVHRTGAASRFTPGDEPVHAREIDGIQTTQ